MFKKALLILGGLLLNLLLLIALSKISYHLGKDLFRFEEKYQLVLVRLSFEIVFIILIYTFRNRVPPKFVQILIFLLLISLTYFTVKFAEAQLFDLELCFNLFKNSNGLIPIILLKSVILLTVLWISIKLKNKEWLVLLLLSVVFSGITALIY